MRKFLAAIFLVALAGCGRNDDHAWLGYAEGDTAFVAAPQAGWVADLEAWLTAAKPSLVASFAKGIVQDHAAVKAALSEPWSNGQTEGHNTKLKLVKRQMYGRAGLDLLRARLLGAP